MSQTTYATILMDMARRDARRQSRRRRVGKALGELATTLIADWLGALLSGWMLMLAVGLIHEHWIPSLPTIGYWWAVLIGFLLRGGLRTNGNGSGKSKDGDR